MRVGDTPRDALGSMSREPMADRVTTGPARPIRRPGYDVRTGKKRDAVKKLMKLLLVVGIGVAILRAMNIETTVEKR